MLLPLKAICDPKKVRKNGTSIIYLQYCFSSTHRTLLSTGISVPPNFWNKKREQIKPELPELYGNYEILNTELLKLKRQIEDIISHSNLVPIHERGIYVKNLYNSLDTRGLCNTKQKRNMLPKPIKKNIHNSDFFTQLDDYIQIRSKQVTKATVAVFKIMKSHLLAFEKYKGISITFKTLDYNFYHSFLDFLTYDYVQNRKNLRLTGLKLNTIGKTIKQLRIFLKDRMKRKIIPYENLSDFKVPEEETDAIYLTNDEIGRIYKTDLSEYPHLEDYKNLFVLACLTGLRFSDFSSLKAADIRGNMLYKKQKKSDHWVVIPLRYEAYEIITAFFSGTAKSFTNPEFNRHIKTIAKMAGIESMITFSYKKGNRDIIESKAKYEWITTHTARRSFCTNEFLAGTPVKLIMKISGHKNEKDFYKYIKVSTEEAANKIQEMWLGRNSQMKVFT